MRVKDAILLAMTKGQLRKAAISLSVMNCDLDDVNQMTDALSKHPQATAEFLLPQLPDAKLDDVVMFVPGRVSPTRMASLNAAMDDDADFEVRVGLSPPIKPSPTTPTSGTTAI